MTATASAPSTERSGFSTLGIAAIVTAAVGFILLVEVFFAPQAVWGGRDNPGAWHPPHSRAEHLVAKMDGHDFAEVAADPTMAHTVNAYFGDTGDAAYRSSRPFQGWLDYLASAGGQRVLLAPAILVLTALTAGAAVLAAADLATAIGKRVPYLGALMATPGFLAAVAYPGICEPLAIALALAGIAAWLRHRPWLAVALFTMGALTRETMLVVPLGLGLTHLWRTRRPTGAWKLAVPAIAYAAWVVVVHARIGVWPSSRPSLDGFVTAVPHWHPAEYLFAAMIVASVVVIMRRGADWMKAIALCHVPLLLTANEQVWWVWLGFGRVATLLPALALVALGSPLDPRVPTPSVVASTRLATDGEGEAVGSGLAATSR